MPLEHKPPPYTRPYVAPAPTLTQHGRCSDCNVTAVLAGAGDLKVCPVCHGLLWHRDWSADERRRKEAAAARAAAEQAIMAQERRAAQEARRAQRDALRDAQRIVDDSEKKDQG
jgi:hypothetical protein